MKHIFGVFSQCRSKTFLGGSRWKACFCAYPECRSSAYLDSVYVIKEVKDLLSNNFEMKNLGEADVILNVKLLREGNGGVTLLQSHYVEKVLSRFGFSDCQPAPTPYDPRVL